jgi:hypothetical protein
LTASRPRPYIRDIEQNHQLPDGTWLSLRIENDSLHTAWTCFWITFVVGEVRPAWYRVFPVGTPPPVWQPMKSAEAVDKQTDPQFKPIQTLEFIFHVQRLRNGKLL